MTTTHSPSLTSRDDGRRGDDGFTLIEILIAIVLVGILSAVAVVGISNLVSKGSSSACQASADAAKAASAVYLTSNAAYPATFNDLTNPVPNGAALTLPSGVTVNTAPIASAVGPPAVTAAAIGMRASNGTNWSLTMTASTGTGVAPTFVCT